MSKTNKPSALEQALFESNEILKAVEENAKNMLLSQMKPDLAKAIRESLEGDDDDNADAYDNSTDDSSETPAIGGDETPDFGGADETPADDAAPEFGGEAEPAADDAAPEGGDEFGDAAPAAPAMGGEPDGDEMDLTGASDEEVISVFKKLGDDAEIEVVPMGNNAFSVKDANGSEVIVKINEGEEDVVGSSPAGNVSVYKDPKKVKVAGSVLENEEDVVGSSPAGNVSVYKDPKKVNVAGSILEDEPVEEDDKYSFMDEEEEEEKETVFEVDLSTEPVDEEDKIDEVARTHADGRKQERKPEGFFNYAASRLRPAERASVNEASANDKALLKEAEEKTTKLISENKVLTEDLAQHKTVLRQLREALDTVGMMNTNLAHVNSLFTKYATTSDEKAEIIKRFDSVETLKESKTLYKTISGELKSGKTTVNETIESVITDKVSGNTGEQLLESTKVDDKHVKGLARIQELIGYSSKK